MFLIAIRRGYENNILQAGPRVVPVIPFFHCLRLSTDQLQGRVRLRLLHSQALEPRRRVADEGLAFRQQKRAGRSSPSHVREHRGAISGGPGHEWAEARPERVPWVAASLFCLWEAVASFTS